MVPGFTVATNAAIAAWSSLFSHVLWQVTGQRADTPTHGLPTRVLDESWTGHLAGATGDFTCLVFVLLAPSARPRVVQSASWLVHELTSPQDVQSSSWRIRELSSYHVTDDGM